MSTNPPPAEAVTRQTIEYFLQSQQPDGTWECASSYTDDPEEAAGRLVRRRAIMPDFTFRIARRTTTVVVQPMPEPTPAAGSDVEARTCGDAQ